MKTRALPAPNGIPARIGHIQWIVMGTEVHENHNWPIGHKNAARQTIEMEASGGTRPVSGSFLCELTTLRAIGSVTIAIMVPTPMPVKARPAIPRDQ